MECPKCHYYWIPRTENPKRCPRCGKWLIAKPIDVRVTDDKLSNI